MTAPEMPPGLLYGTVEWTVLGWAPDSSDEGDLPDAHPVNGTVTLSPNIEAGKGIRVISPKMTLLQKPQTYRIVNGRMQDASGRVSPKFVACNSPGTVPQEWEYQASYELEDGYTFGTVFFKLYGGETVYLSDLMQTAPESDGTIYVEGEQPTQLIIGPTRPTNPAPGTVFIRNTYP